MENVTEHKGSDSFKESKKRNERTGSIPSPLMTPLICLRPCKATMVYDLFGRFNNRFAKNAFAQGWAPWHSEFLCPGGSFDDEELKKKAEEMKK
eukprot:5041421-Amphidinium_carterae.1